NLSQKCCVLQFPSQGHSLRLSVSSVQSHIDCTKDSNLLVPSISDSRNSAMAFVFARPVWSTPAASRLGKWLEIASGLLLFSAYTAITTSCCLPAQLANLSAAGASSKLSSFEFANHGWGGHIRVSVSLPPATVGNAYNAVVSVSGGMTPYQMSVVSGSVPIGLSLILNAAT